MSDNKAAAAAAGGGGNTASHKQQQQEFAPLLIKAGLVFSESVPLCELLCKPKLLPIRSAALERLEHLDEKITEQRRKEDAAAKASMGASSGFGSMPAGGAGVPLIAETLVTKVDFSGTTAGIVE